MLNVSELAGVCCWLRADWVHELRWLAACEWFRNWLSVLPQYAVCMCVFGIQSENSWASEWRFGSETSLLYVTDGGKQQVLRRDIQIWSWRMWRGFLARAKPLAERKIKSGRGKNWGEIRERERAWSDLWRNSKLPFLFLYILSGCSQSRNSFFCSVFFIIICQVDFTVSWISHLSSSRNKMQIQKAPMAVDMFFIYISAPHSVVECIHDYTNWS